MRKFYSFVLMAAALLIGTNAWANVHNDYVAPNPDQEILGDEAAVTIGGVTKYADKFKEAWDYVQDGQTAKITLKRDVTITTTLWLGTAEQSGTTRTIEIDLAGHDFSTTAQRGFVLTHGVLKFTTSVPNEEHNKVAHSGSKEAIYITGSTKKDVDPSVDGANYFSHFVLGEGVTLNKTSYDAAIAIDAIWDGSPVTSLGVNYWTNVYSPAKATQNKGVANGVRVDIYGAIDGTRYGIKPNGYLGNVKYFKEEKKGNADIPVEGWSPLYENAKLDADYKIMQGDDGYSPFIHIYPSAKIKVANEKPSGEEKSPAGIYAAGYARWIIEGKVEGASGVIVKSGSVTIDGADIHATGPYQPATHTTSGNTAQGSAILIVSDSSWPGEVNVTINGSTEAKSDKGYAIEEDVVITNTKVDALTINGGTFTGGTEGAISISEETKQANETTETTNILVNSATITGNVEYGNNGELVDIIPSNKEDITIAYNDQTQQYTVVVTVVDTPAQITDDFDIDDAEENSNVNLSGDDLENKAQRFDSDSKATLTLGTLTINNLNDDVTLTITAGHTIIANKVILGDKAQIIVEPGASLIVKGSEGIVSTKPENIVLQANDQAQATFLLNPAVVNNAEPNATVQMYTVCKQTSVNPYYYTFQEFALPVKEGVRPDNDYESQTLYPGYSQLSTSVRAFDYGQHNWAYLNSWSQLQPFTNYQMTNNTKDGGLTYSFEGKLLGNKNRYCQFVDEEGFGYFGNSHMAPISIKKLLADFSADVEQTVWIYNYGRHQWQYATSEEDLFGNKPTEIKSMQAFVLYLNEGTTSTAPINYANAVYGNPRFDAPLGRNQNGAPARSKVNSLNNGALISVIAANGMADDVVLMENDSYTENFDNGSDASKLMNEDGINLYATTAIGNLSCVADNSIENTRLTFKAGEATEYTLELGKVFGEDYVIRDNVTGAIFNCAEGVVYNFTQAENSVVEGRFEIIAVAKVATAIENAEVKANVKGVYSITGMYLGEDLNVLPAGVYVVNGTKVIK